MRNCTLGTVTPSLFQWASFPADFSVYLLLRSNTVLRSDEKTRIYHKTNKLRLSIYLRAYAHIS